MIFRKIFLVGTASVIDVTNAIKCRFNDVLEWYPDDKNNSWYKIQIERQNNTQELNIKL